MSKILDRKYLSHLVCCHNYHRIKVTISINLVRQNTVGSRIPDSISDKWLKLVRQLRTLNKLVIPRQNIMVIKDEILSIELHAFCDSSIRVYGSLAYLRGITLHGCFVSLLFGKTKVALMKGFSIPGLKLLGCV